MSLLLTEMDFFSHNLSTHIHLMDTLAKFNFQFIPGTPNERPLEDTVKSEALNLIAVCLAIDTDDHVVVTEGARGFVVAKAKPTNSEDDDRATRVFRTLRAIRTRPAGFSVKSATSVLIEQDFGHALVQRQVRDLDECVSQVDLVSDLAKAIEERYEPLKCKRLLDLMDRLTHCVSALSLMDKLDMDCLAGLLSLVQKSLHSLPLSHDEYLGVSELHAALQAFDQWVKAISSLVEYLASKSLAFLHHRLISTTVMPHAIPIKLDMQSTLREIASPLPRHDLEGKDKRLWSKLMKIYNLEDDRTCSPALCVHPEIKIILDQRSHETPAVQGIRIIGSNVEPCVCCMIWTRFYNERFHTAWRCRDGYVRAETDWAAPSMDAMHGLDFGVLNDLSEALLAEVRRLLSTFIDEQFEDVKYYSIGSL